MLSSDCAHFDHVLTVHLPAHARSREVLEHVHVEDVVVEVIYLLCDPSILQAFSLLRSIGADCIRYGYLRRHLVLQTYSFAVDIQPRGIKRLPL